MLSLVDLPVSGEFDLSFPNLIWEESWKPCMINFLEDKCWRVRFYTALWVMPSSVRQTACGLFYWPPLLSFCFAPKFLYFFYLASATHLTLTPGLHLRITQTHEHRFTGVHSLHIAGLRPLHAAPVFRRSRVAQLKQNLSIFSAIRARERETSLVIAAFLTTLTQSST